MSSRLIILTLGTLVLVSPIARAADSYDCTATAHTNVGWSVSRKAYTAEASTKLSSAGTVKLSGMNTKAPDLMGQSVAKLQLVGDDGSTRWFVERTPAGTVVSWTFFNPQKDGVPTAVLVSSKSYDLFGGPVNFTDVYSCKPNSPMSR